MLKSSGLHKPDREFAAIGFTRPLFPKLAPYIARIDPFALIIRDNRRQPN